MRRLLLVAVLAVGVLAAPAAAQANMPGWGDVNDAKATARWYWQDYRNYTVPCYGVQIRYSRPGWIDSQNGRMERGDLGYTYTARGRSSCRIYLNMNQRWTWAKLCTTVVHEYGHVVGFKDIYWRTRSIMYGGYPSPVWGKRFWAC
jgi:hypothetical protein